MSDVRGLLDEIFEQQALAIGGLVATHDVADDVVWRLMKNLAAIRTRAMERLSSPRGLDGISRSVNPEPHPAIQEFLESLNKGGESFGDQ